MSDEHLPEANCPRCFHILVPLKNYFKLDNPDYDLGSRAFLSFNVEDFDNVLFRLNPNPNLKDKERGFFQLLEIPFEWLTKLRRRKRVSEIRETILESYPDSKICAACLHVKLVKLWRTP